MFFAGNDFFGYPSSYRAQPQRNHFNNQRPYAFYDDYSDDEVNQDYFSQNYRPQTAKSQRQRHQQELLQRQQEQIRAKQLREQEEQLKRRQEEAQYQAQIRQLQKELEEEKIKNAQKAKKQAIKKAKRQAKQDAKLKENNLFAEANSKKNIDALSTDESDDNLNKKQSDDELIIIEDVEMNYWEILGISPLKNTLKEGIIDENYPEEVESLAKQLSALLKKDISECLRLANANRNYSIGQLIDVALNGSSSL